MCPAWLRCSGGRGYRTRRVSTPVVQAAHGRDPDDLKPLRPDASLWLGRSCRRLDGSPHYGTAKWLGFRPNLRSEPVLLRHVWGVAARDPLVCWLTRQLHSVVF